MTDAVVKNKLEVEEEAESAVERQRGKSFEELLAALPAADDAFTVRIMPGMPGVAAVCEAMIRYLGLAWKRIESAEEEIARTRWDFDWIEDGGGATEQQIALAELAEARETLEELQSGLFRWFRFVGAGRVVELSDEAWRVVADIVEHAPVDRMGHWFLETLIHGALIHLNEAADIDKAYAIARAKQAGRPRKDERLEWPYTQPGGAPWPQEAGTPSSADRAVAAEPEDEAGDDGEREWPEVGPDPVRVQVWKTEETGRATRCILDLAVVTRVPGGADRRDCFLAKVARLAAEQTAECTAALARRADRAISNDSNAGGNESDPAEAASVPTGPPVN